MKALIAALIATMLIVLALLITASVNVHPHETNTGEECYCDHDFGPNHDLCHNDAFNVVVDLTKPVHTLHY